MKTLILMGGMPGSGKSTKVAALKHHLDLRGIEIMVVRPDDYLDINGKYVWTPKRSANAWNLAYAQLNAWLKVCLLPDMVSVCIFDATLLDRKSRAKLIQIAKPHGVKIRCVFMNTPKYICVSRNDKRTPDRRVPDATMDSMFARLTLPVKEEGFDCVDILTTPETEDVIDLETCDQSFDVVEE